MHSRLLISLTLLSCPALAQVAFTDDLNGATTGARNGGQFVSGGGWQAGHQVKWDLGAALTEGSFSVELLNWNPSFDSPQHQFDKQQILAMYEAPHGSPHQADADSPKTSSWQVRTGANYNNCFKFLSSPAGFTDRQETRISRQPGELSPAQPHTIEVRWTRAGNVAVFVDGVEGVTHRHGTALRLRYVFIGTDDAPGGTYGPQAGVIFRNVRVNGTTAPVVPPVDAGVPPTPGGSPSRFVPSADTWTDPLNPTAVHGSDGDLRTGGDGRTIYFRFDVQGVGQVSRARLVLRAMNAGGGGDVRRVLDTSWSETSVTHQNRPMPEPSVLASLGRVEIDSEYAFDVTSAVRGNGACAFAITSTDGDGSGYLSRESAENRPELVVEWSGTPGTGGGSAGGGPAAGGVAGGGAAGGGSAGGGAAAGGAAGGAAMGGGLASGGGQAGGASAPTAGGEPAQRIQVKGGCAAAGGGSSWFALVIAMVLVTTRRLRDSRVRARVH
ncbi:MAG: DNRLRE domain-containing protein [Myxococcaceae bacterium]|nr:DNRLRE domain-containing protein [Myxococcaceae bacterium]